MPARRPDRHPDPATTRAQGDPGDATQRNYRYQHGYGVILLAAAARGERPYVALWCEHHEDLLAQRADGRFDAFQVKTSRPELGAWKMTDGDVVKSVGRFVELIRTFGDRIAGVYFVSNTEFDESTEARRIGKRPRAFLEHVRGCARPGDVVGPFAETFTQLQGQCGCSAAELLEAVRRMDLIPGPPRNAFEAVIAHEHIGRLPVCRGLEPARLDEWCERLLAVVWRACSLAVTDPIRHLNPLVAGAGGDPALAGKRLVVAEVMAYEGRGGPSAPYVFPGEAGIRLGDHLPPSVLRAKLERGDLADQVDYLRARVRAAEYNLLELAAREPAALPALLRQVEEVVLGECTEAHLRARVGPEPYGPAMMIDVQDRLRGLARDRPAMVGHQPYECLMGVVGMLTTDTRVWWSPRFPVQESAA